MYNGMDKAGPWASLYFIFLMIFGNYVLFSLLVAILVEGFSDVIQFIIFFVYIEIQTLCCFIILSGR
jgi:hypothetical protein